MIVKILAITVFTVIFVVCSADIEADKKGAMKEIVAYLKCREGYEDRNGEFKKVVADCKAEHPESGLCSAVCVWLKLGYVKIINGTATTDEKAIAEWAMKLYPNSKLETKSDKASDFITCFKSNRPTKNFQYVDQCVDISPFLDCYRAELQNECE